MPSKEALKEALGLKDVVRAGWVRAGVESPESVAAHSWGMALLATQLCPDDLNLQRVLELCILHDIAEVHVGDIRRMTTCPQKRNIDVNLKQSNRWISPHPPPSKRIYSLSVRVRTGTFSSVSRPACIISSFVPGG